jgi:hypothetical protein
VAALITGQIERDLRRYDANPKNMRLLLRAVCNMYARNAMKKSPAHLVAGPSANRITSNVRPFREWPELRFYIQSLPLDHRARVLPA